MNRNRIVAALAIAMVLGLAASIFVYQKFKQASTVKAVETRGVVVAAMPLPLGVALQPQHLRVVQWPVSSVVAGTHGNIEECTNRALLNSVVENQPILEANLAAKDAGVGLAATLPEGMRALSVRVDDVISVAGFVLPSTMVDVLVTGQPPGGGQNITRTILERIRVLTAGQRVEQDKKGQPQTVSVITLMLTPEQADALAMASTQGRIHLALRNASDANITNPPPYLQAALYAGAAPPRAPATRERPKAAPPPPKPPPPPAFVMEVIAGSKRETATFQTP